MLRNYIDDQVQRYSDFKTSCFEYAKEAVAYLGNDYEITEIATGYKVSKIK